MSEVAKRGGAILLVRNSVEHDARVLRAARVAGRALDEPVLVVGVASGAALAGTTRIEGMPVVRLPARAPGLARLLGSLQRISSARSPKGTMSQPDPAVDKPVSNATGALPIRARARRILAGCSFSWQAIAVARRTRPRLVQANDWNTMWAGIAIKLLCGARLVYDSHELWPDRNGRWERRSWLLAGEALFVRVADQVVTSSPGYAKAMARRYRVQPPIVVRNIPERPERNPHARLAKAGGPPAPALVLYLGGLMPGRGLEQMIDALPLIGDVRLRAVGPGPSPYRASLLARARSAQVEDRIELCAPVAPSEVQSVMSGAAAGLCLIQPICRSYELCLPNKLFEYAAAGVPVLASDVPVIAEVVRDVGLGEVVGADDPDAIAAGLTRLLGLERWGSAAARAREFADANDWGREACTLNGVYGRALDGVKR